MRVLRRSCTLFLAALILLSGCGGAHEFHTGSADQPGSAATLTLAQVAERLAKMSDADYQLLQQKWTGSKEAACNHFVATALCEAGEACDSTVRKMLADEYDTYLVAHGWEKVELDELQRLFASGQAFAAILQNDGLNGEAHGHVAIPVRMSGDGKSFDVAEGELDEQSHLIRHDGESYLKTERIFVRR
jgi:hypothetical protein